MKDIIKIISFCLLSIAYVACDDMYEIHKEYLDEGELIYLGKSEIVRIQGGQERLQLVWKLTADPKVEKCCIYWNNKQDSLEVAPNYTDTVMRQIIPLKEGAYMFEIINKGKNNLRSLMSVASGKSYGEEYFGYLRNRILQNQKITAVNDTLIMSWGTEENCVGLELEYINNEGLKKQVFLKGDKTELRLLDFTPEGEFKYRSLYIPEKQALDTIPYLYETNRFPALPAKGRLNNTNTD